MRTYTGIIHKLKENQIFVFGSNMQGRHGKGAARWAVDNAGAIYGQARGLQGNAWGIITKDLNKRIHPSISRQFILSQLRDLLWFATEKVGYEFIIPYRADSVNLNGYTPEQMASMFAEFMWPDNVLFEERFAELMNNSSR